MRASALCVAAVLLLAGCGSDAEDPGDPAAAPSSASSGALAVEYAPGLTEYLVLPDEAGAAPLVVMVPGGSWMSADPTGFTGLATSLAEAGIIAVPTTIRAAQDGVTYPVPVEDVLCAVAGAVAEAEAQGFEPTTVTVLGHSSGAHLASLATLATDDFTPACSADLVEPDAFIGLAGPYDIGKIEQFSGALFDAGPEEDPESWAAANPVRRTDLRTDVPVLLMTGGADPTVPTSFAEELAAVLEDAGNPVTLEIVDEADHFSIFAPYLVGEPIARWLLALD